MAEVMIWSPFFRFAYATPLIAKLSLSVPPLVKTISAGVTARKEAIRALAALDGRPRLLAKAWRLEGLRIPPRSRVASSRLPADPSASSPHDPCRSVSCCHSQITDRVLPGERRKIALSARRLGQKVIALWPLRNRPAPP